MNIVQFMKQFMGMEKKFDLFHVQNREKIYYWDLARLEIFEDLYFSRITRSPIHIYPEQTAIRKIHGLLTLLFKAVKNETLRFIKTFKKRYDYILFTCSRYRDKKGNTVDWASEDILSRIRQRSFLIETILPVDQKIRKGFYYLYGLALRRIRNHIIYKYGKRKESFPVNAIIKKTFHINADFAPTLIKLISYYKSDYLYYRKLFWKIRPKAIFLLQNGVQRALIKAAHDLAIPVLEIQHGRVGFVHPVYSYNPKISYDHLTYFPDYFLSFSDYWNKNYFFPVENRRTIGNNHYYIHPAGNDRRTFTVVFINGLEKITRDLAGKCPDMTIYVKLRHSDEPMRHHYNRMFAGHPNIKVIFDEKNILDLYRISHSILAVESTAVYEALQSQTKVFIAMIRNYHTHEDVFSHKNVYLVKNATDIVKHINKPVKKDPDNIYFESFKTEKFQAVLKEIDELQNKKILHKGWKDVKECFLCGNKKFIPLYTVPDRHYGAKGHFHISQCKNCSLVFLNPMPGKEDLNRLYPQDSYYSYQNFLQKKKSWKYRLERFFIRIETKDPLLEPGKLLDIGCGSGSFLYDMRKKGWETFGVEISKNACDTGKRSGLNIFCGTLAEARFKKDQFDYIRSNHSFEHMVDPNRTLEEMRRILKPGGKVLIGVPHIKSMNATVFKEYWYYLGAPFHPFNYSVITLQKMLEKHGFIVEKVRYNSNYQGILGSLQIFVNRKTGRLSHEGNIINNHFLKVIFQWLARLLDLLHRGDCIEIIASKRSKR